jgi:hypothetical protein
VADDGLAVAVVTAGAKAEVDPTTTHAIVSRVARIMM